MNMIEQEAYAIPSSIAQDGEPFSEPTEARPSHSAIQILTQLLRNKRLILRVTVIFMVLGLILAFILPVQFTAETKIMPPKQTQSTLAMLMSQMGLGMGSLAD
jgi:uncharacterized protein involved in exopolysaccharide biosynthesis